MTMKLVCGCLLAVALFGSLADAQLNTDGLRPRTSPLRFTQEPQQPQRPQPPQPPQRPQQTLQTHQHQTHQHQTHQHQTHQHQTHQHQTHHHTKQTNERTSEIFHTCEVAESKKIHCGAPGISASGCKAINCCYDGHMCHYGKAVTLQCTKDAQMIVVVARDATLPNLDLESISFLAGDQACNPVDTTSAFAIYQFPVTACGTVMTEEPGYIIYENRMSSLYEVAIGPKGRITRDSHYDLLIQCKYVGTSVEALVIEVGHVPPPPPVAAPGPLRVELRLANGQCATKGCVEEDVAYSSFYMDTDYPVSKVLRDPVYVEVRMLERTDPSIVLTLGRCWANLSPYAYNLPQWDLLIDGCPYRDDRYLTSLVNVDLSSGLMFPSHYKRFIFKMFTFVDAGGSNPSKGGTADQGVMMPLKEKIYIHCDALVCQPTISNNCEPRCYRKRRDVAASVLGSTRPETTLVSSKEIVFIDPNQSVQ